MTGKEPIQEQVKELWEWCGFRYKLNDDPLMCFWETNDGSTWGYKLPPVDPNNLFKYAVPQFAIKFGITKTRELLHKWINDAYMSLPEAKDLMLAMWGVIKE